MLWEGRTLRDIREADIRRIIDSGLQEPLQLEYKSGLYEDGDRGRREFLLDICMFANASGGILLIGMPEGRDEDGQPTGTPDREAVLGLDIPNPEGVLSAYDARVMEAIEERLPLESASIAVGEGRHVLAIRVPNSSNKPHSVRHQGHIYFPSRRERQRYPLTVREIKETVMRTASRLQQSEEALTGLFSQIPIVADHSYLILGLIPVFFEDFAVDLRADALRLTLGHFSRVDPAQYVHPTYSFNGLERREGRFDYTVRFWRNGLLNSSQPIPVIRAEEGRHHCAPTAIDMLLRQFVLRARLVYEAASLGPPYLLAMMLRTRLPLIGVYGMVGGGEDHTEPLPRDDYLFPFMQLDDLSTADRIIRPFCDQVHQMFGKEGSPMFNAEGAWNGR